MSSGYSRSEDRVLAWGPVGVHCHPCSWCMWLESGEVAPWESYLDEDLGMSTARMEQDRGVWGGMKRAYEKLRQDRMVSHGKVARG